MPEQESATLYTIAAIHDVVERLAASTAAANEDWVRQFIADHPPVHLTWRGRLRARRWDYEARIKIAYAALRGRHDCGGW